MDLLDRIRSTFEKLKNIGSVLVFEVVKTISLKLINLLLLELQVNHIINSLLINDFGKEFTSHCFCFSWAKTLYFCIGERATMTIE